MVSEAKLWFGVLAAPIVWAIQMQIGFMLVPWACATGLRPYLWVAPALGIVVSLLAAAAAWSMRRDANDRARFMAFGGVLLSGSFAIVIMAQSIPTFILSPCQ